MSRRSLVAPCRFGSCSRTTGQSVLLSLILFVLASPAQAVQLGQWSPVASWETNAVPLHLALVRGDGDPFHSRIVWWGNYGGGVFGWRADGAGCNAFPDTTGATPTLHPLHPAGVNEDLFCGGQTQLADGRSLRRASAPPLPAAASSTRVESLPQARSG